VLLVILDDTTFFVKIWNTFLVLTSKAN
jgi:hypothetical protein